MLSFGLWYIFEFLWRYVRRHVRWYGSTALGCYIEHFKAKQDGQCILTKSKMTVSKTT